MRDLEDLNRRWWDWQADRWDGSGLRLIADNDLTYHHSVEVKVMFSELSGEPKGHFGVVAGAPLSGGVERRNPVVAGS